MPTTRFAIHGASLLMLTLAAMAFGAEAWPQPPPPTVTVWAWERPEDLRFLDPERHAVAILVGTIKLDAGHMVPSRRRQPLRLPTGIGKTAVVRLEATPGAVARRSEVLAAEVAERVVAWAEALGATAVQIDFDARVSERLFYRILVDRLRGRLLATTRLEITALASWCLGDPWIADLAIDEAIPMLFRMGVDNTTVRAHLGRGGDFAVPLCRQSLGLSLDEPLERLPPGRQIHLFNPQRWSPPALANFERDLRSRGPR